MSKKSNKKKEAGLKGCFAKTYGVELFFSEPVPEIAKEELLAKLNEECGNVELAGETDNVTSYAFLDYSVEYEKEKIPPKIAILTTDKEIDHSSLDMTLYQSWDFENVREVVSGCKYSLIITDLMSANLYYKTRLNLFQKFLFSSLELLPCQAIHWSHSQQILEPKKYIENTLEHAEGSLLYGALNVRLFNVSDAEKEEMLMDTMGLSAFGLPDLQCHFRGLEPNLISRHLYAYAGYIFDKGDVIGSGSTIEGLNGEGEWVCQHEMSLTEPSRVVLDINPGKGYAAGNR